MYLIELIFLRRLLPKEMTDSCKVFPTFESLNSVMWCDHSNETSSVVLSHGTICFPEFYEMKFGNFVGLIFLLQPQIIIAERSSFLLLLGNALCCAVCG